MNPRSGTSFGGTRSSRRVGSLVLVVGLVALLLPAALGIAPAGAIELEPVHVNFTLEGCRAAPSAYIAPGTYTCPDAAYTTGNLAKGWHELDLVPHRLTTSLGSQSAATTTYKVAVAADNMKGTFPGYDAIVGPSGTGGPAVNGSKSHASCAVTVEASPLGGSIMQPGLGGADATIFKVLTITQNKGTTCVFDWAERLAVDSHLYSGSSLHSNAALVVDATTLTTQGIGSRDVSIPVKDILPQSLSKDMTASRDASARWEITKSASPTELDFDDSCADDASFSDETEITVSWDKVAVDPSGNIDTLTTISATNPAHRAIDVTVTDEIFAGATPGLAGSGTAGPGGTGTVAAGGTADIVDEVAQAIPATGSFATATSISDRAAGSYTDTVTGIPITQTTTATDSTSIQSGSTANAAVDIVDVEQISGTGFTYSVDSMEDENGDAMTAVGTFTVPDGSDEDEDPDTYTLGTETDADVTWTLEDQTDDGQVTFVKTVYLDEPRESSSGTLSDDAYVFADGVRTAADALDSDSESVDLSASATVSITIEKTLPDIIGTGDDPETFEFDIWKTSDLDSNGDPNVGATPVNATAIAITFDDTDVAVGGNLVKSETYSGLETDGYTVRERDRQGWIEAADFVILESDWANDGSLVCSLTASFTNSFGPATAKALKVTDPTGAENGWTMCLAGPGTEAIDNPGTDLDGKECVVTATGDHDGDPNTATVAGVAPFTTTLLEGNYTITEVLQTDWQQMSSSGDCSFTVTYPADFDRVFTCTFTNRENSYVTVEKTVSGQTPPSGDTYTFQIRSGASATQEGTVLRTDTTDAAGDADFGGTPLAPGTYQFCETGLLPGWHSTISDLAGAFVPNSDELIFDNSTVCVSFTLAAGEDKVFQVDNTPPPGGDARTIGFWRNWTSCDGHGNQAPVMDQNLGAGILIGDLNVDTCAKAVNILSKRSLSGTNKASDAAYGLAAQLLAVELNLRAGASPTCVEASRLAAQNLLNGTTTVGAAKIDFLGTGDYLTSKAKGNLATLRNMATSLANTLDQYNNNTLSCP